MATTKITSPDLFDLGSLNTALQLPSGTTAERPTSPSTGEWRYNTTTNLIEFYDGADWIDLQSEDIPPTPSEHFNTVLYTGTNSAQSITGVGFQPDLIWFKNRTGTNAHALFDSSRGNTSSIYPNTTDPANTSSAGQDLTAFDSDGFSVGTVSNAGSTNASGGSIVAWCFKANGGTTSSNTEGSRSSTVQANTKGGFSIVEWTGDGNTATIGHGLNAAPELIIVKTKTAVSDWPVYSSGLTSAAYRLVLNSDAAQSTTNDEWNSTAPTSTVFSVGNGGNVSGSGQDFVGYCFHSVAGYSKIGSYTGTGSTTNRPIINTGFEPAFVMIKNITTADDWMIHDNKRNPSNPRDKYLRANTADQEGQFAEFGLDFLTNGFLVGPTTNNNWNGSGQTYIYMAVASDPSAAPTLANSFKSVAFRGVGQSRSIGGLGFSPSLVWVKCRDAVGQHSWFDTFRGPLNRLDSTSTSSQSNVANTLTAFNTEVITYTETLKGTDNGFTFGNEAGNNAGETNVAWMWKAGPLPTINTDGTDTSIVSANVAAGFSIAALPNKAGTQNLGHGLDGVPDLIIMKQYEGGTGNWSTYNSPVGVRNFMNLNTSAANTVATPGYEYDAVTATTITNLVSNSTYSYIYYCWKNVAGFSKVGSYTGNSSTQAITGLGFSPNWVMIKETDGVDSWEVYDTARGATNVLYPNGTNAEGVNTGLTSFDSDGFTLGSATSANESGKNYIYVAYAQNPAQPAVASGEMEYLVVAGGGGSSSDSGGGAGGGAGGLRTSYGDISGGGASAETAITLATGTYTVTVGAGGAKYNGVTTAQNGGVSSISGTATVNTVGGGGAGDSLSSPTIYQGANGGSGGGSGNGNANYSRNTGGTGTTGEGFFGGGARDYAVNDDRNSGGGGGGAAEGGSNGQSYKGGNGGNGLMVAIDGTSAVYAGGGGGGCRGNVAQNKIGAGGEGGGGYGANSGAGNDGTVNTGGGAGGGRSDGANGGSGIVILRMNTSDYSGTTSGNPTITTSGSETILKYLASGSYVHNPSTAAGKMNYMVLAGGASGASNGGGGGAGGLRSSWYASGGGAVGETPITLSSGTYTITIGAGGALVDNTTSYQDPGNDGSATTISGNATVNTVGGGGGGSNNTNAGRTGGSGGGAGASPGTPYNGGSGTAGEGFDGGRAGAVGHPYTGAGGGGTGAVGGDNSGSAPGAGGAGASITITGTGVNYGGGGGGTGGTGVGYTGPGGAGGTGGGGAGGAYNGNGVSGTANTGGGGGGSGDGGSFTSGAGGSGLVILRLQTSEYSGTTTGSPTVTTVGTETVLTFTGSGTYVHS